MTRETLTQRAGDVQEDLSSLLIDSSIDVIIAIDRDRNIIAWNNTAEMIFRHPRQLVLGKPMHQVIPSIAEDEETLQAIELAESGKKSFVPASNLFAHRRQAENHFIPLTTPSGQLKGVMNLVHDVAHRIKAEENLQNLNDELQRRMRQLKVTSDELSNFTYVTSNKIKEPIRHAYTAIEHLIKVEARNLSDSGKASFRRLQSSLSRMDLLIDDMLKLSQISILDSPEDAIDLTVIASDVKESIMKHADKQVNITVKEDCVIYGHHDYIRLLVFTLVDNAVKFNHNPVAQIQVETESVTIDRKDFCRLTVSDNGIGFNQEEANRIFVMFEKLHPGKYRGSGIGLTLAKKIMEVYDGFIDVESSPSQGSSFHCYFRLQNSVSGS